ncbi:MAG TPA: hypothetical protein VHR47_07300 [Bacillota bacterium]|nr:hypothetical protein [Bacillota bacterium]
MVFGEERPGRLADDPEQSDQLYLRFIRTDLNVFKMKGDFPRLWKIENCRIDGPRLLGEDGLYKIVGVDYTGRKLWLVKVTC